MLEEVKKKLERDDLDWKEVEEKLMAIRVERCLLANYCCDTSNEIFRCRLCRPIDNQDREMSCLCLDDVTEIFIGVL